MSAVATGILEHQHHRARLFPLSVVTSVWGIPTGSARNRRRLTIHRTVNTVFARAVHTLNRMYDSSSRHHHSHRSDAAASHHSQPSSSQSSSSSRHHSSSPHHSHHSARPGNSSRPTDDSSPTTTAVAATAVRVTTSSRPTFVGSAAQRRLLEQIYSHCSRFVKTVRASVGSITAAGAVCDIDTRRHDVILDAWVLSIAGVSDVVGMEGPLPAVTGIDPTATAARAHTDASLPSTSSYSSAPTTVTPLLAHRIALPSDLKIVPLSSVLPASIVAAYSAASSAALLRHPTELFLLNMSDPIRAPRIAGARIEYVKLIARLVQQRMVAFTAAPMAVNGVFAVNKDADADRLIIDAQPANRLFIESPHVALPDASTIVQLQVPADATMFVGKSDLSNYYHHLGMPTWMQPYFALPRLSVSELRSIGVDADTDTAAYPMCVTLPMGFSHAVYLAEQSHEHVLYSAGVLSRDDNILSMTSPSVRSDRVLHGIVIDDFFTFCLDRDVATRQFDRVVTAYRAAGFVVKDSKVVRPTCDTVKVIGFEINGRDATVDLAADAQVSLIRATLAALAVGEITGLGLAHIIGRWTWIMLLRRSSLACLQHVYRYIQVVGRRRFTIWPSVRRELWMLLGLLPLLRASLSSPMFHRVIASDASEDAAGVVSTQLTPALHDRLWRLCSTRRHATMQAVLNASERRGDDMPTMISTSSSTVDDAYADAAALCRSSSDAYHEFYDDVMATHWSTVISQSWRSPEHINALELRAALLSVHWVLTYPSSVTRRVYLLVDSTVAFFCMWKGRSSSPALLLILRKLSALLLASGVSLLPGWIPSIVNPADGPSRLRPIGTVGNAAA